MPTDPDDDRPPRGHLPPVPGLDELDRRLADVGTFIRSQRETASMSVRRLAELVRSSAAAGFTAPVVIDGDDEVAELSRAFDAAARAVRDQLLETARRDESNAKVQAAIARSLHALPAAPGR